ncbi:hypothetical protein RvY_03533 [Ramazzottius varieornatus]|uniref:Major facilitator superfamily (MFS) profile domain-containing protein n=1 Tax=Ramazzottius varieornatus TaxID=947166 RepID=A0A1D1UXR6_RAMVA|nr:hypothetical protein RvY_03533 [Ramazzottius varieornatus]
MGPGEGSGGGRCTWPLLLAVFTVSFGLWFADGYVSVVMNGPQSLIVRWIRTVHCAKYTLKNSTLLNNASLQDGEIYLWCRHIAPEDEPTMLSENLQLNTLWALCSSINNVGWLLSIFVTMPLLRAFGLKGALLVDGGLYIAFNLVFALATFLHSYEMFVIGKLLLGFTGGTCMVLVPTYVSEITPVKLRGNLGTIPMVFMVLGMICATALGFPQALGNEDGWRYLMGLSVLPPALMLLVLPFCPDSPRRLYIEKKEREGARKALLWLRRSDNVQQELASMQIELERQTHHQQLTIFGIFRHRRLRSTIGLCLVVMVARQFSGYAVICNYSTAIFEEVGLQRQGALLATLGLWCVSLVGTLSSLILVDRAGRKRLLLIGQAGLIVSHALFVALAALKKEGHGWTEYGSVACLLAVLVFYQTGLSMIAYILPAELFTQEARSAAMSLATGCAAACAITTTFLFPVLQSLLQEYTYLIFVAVLIATFSFLALKLPETKGKTTNEIQDMLDAKWVDVKLNKK